MSLPVTEYGAASENLQLAPMLDDALFDSFFGPCPLELPPLQQIPQSKNSIQSEETWLRPSIFTRDKDVTFDGANLGASSSKDGQATAGHAIKNAVPLAEVLNEDRPVSKLRRASQEHEPTSRRKIRRIEEDCKDDIWQLPRPNVTKSLESAPLIPPLIQGIHEPPPNAGLIPSITDRPSKIFSGRIEFPDAPPGLPTRLFSDLPPVDLPPFRLDLNENQTSIKSKGLIRSSRSPRLSDCSKEAGLRSDKRSQSAKNRKPWSDQETRDLLQGVAQHGIGRWKEILASSECTFHNRTAIDLKDRFRVCRPQDYTSVSYSPSEPQRNTSKSTRNAPRGDFSPQPRASSIAGAGSRDDTALHPHKRSRKKTEISLPEVGVKQPLVRQERRTRHAFSAEEDAALLRGFEVYGPKWKEILAENALDKDGRTARDLRDRFRNRWPERYERAGLKPGGKGEERRRAYREKIRG
ncbi:MAG: hypothetical protein M1831_000624 [Alyxoria varia]|nr:MAG: hypothetical protein M1831_000624 [Alyxoria varia]